MPILVPGSLLTVTDVQTYLRVKPITNATDKASAEAAVRFAVAAIADVLGFDPEGEAYDLADSDLDLLRGIGVRIAAQAFTNPQDRQTFSSPEGLSFTGSPQVVGRIMGEADRRTLVGIQLRYAPGFG